MPIDYEAEARKFGGSANGGVDDYATVAAKFGGTPVSVYEQQAQADTTGQNLMAGIGGAMYAPWLGIKSAIGKADPGEVQRWKESMAGLWSTPGGKIGTVGGGAAVAAPLALIPGVNSAVGAPLAGAALGALQPAENLEERGKNTAIGGVGGFIGRAMGNAFQNMVNPTAAQALIAQQAQRAAIATPRADALREAQAAGYRIPPWLANPQDQGVINSTLGGISGKLKTQQQASIINDPISYAIAQKEVGLPPTTPLTKENLQTVRDAADQAYGELKKFGTIKPTPEFKTALDGAVSEYKAIVADFPGGEFNIPKIDKLVKGLTNKEQFRSVSLVPVVRRLRYDGFKNIRSPDPETSALGLVQLKAQNAIEDMIDANLRAAGQGDFLQVFRNARTLIAKTHTVENALEAGGINAQKIGKEFIGSGKKISGGLATIGRTAEYFPKAMQKETMAAGPGWSPLDYTAASTAAILGSMATGNLAGAAAAAIPLARPAIRSMLLSGPYQAAMVRPHVPTVPTMPQGLLNPPNYAPYGTLAGLMSSGLLANLVK